MLFSSPVFLFLFLPLALAGCALAPRALRNAWLLVASLVFYAWGQPAFALVMLASIAVNWALGLAVERSSPLGARLAVAAAVVFDLGLLALFKYWNFLWDNLEALFPGLERFPAAPIPLPIGISFFTFQALSYVIDVARRDARAQKSPLDFGLYIALFPQLIAGPIVRYRDVAEQLANRTVGLARFASGVRRFVIGLGKKLLVADLCGQTADAIFGLDPALLDAGTAWLGTACYTAQIYFDFSGYSDMAIGLARMFGFELRENFLHPYVARSVTEFWRRWHVSLSTWFRDYLYVPLGGNRKGKLRTYANLLLVFFLCGLWHGAAWTFVVWGLYHGAFLVLERAFRGRASPERRGSWAGWAYTLLVAMVGWVLFRSSTLEHAGLHLRAMAGLGTGDGRAVHAGTFLDPLLVTVLAAAVVGSTPWLKHLAAWRERRFAERGGGALDLGLGAASLAGVLAVALLSSAMLAAGTYNPFIYFRF
jgi:alginate O-acetyltransferase complex protein AlgI